MADASLQIIAIIENVLPTTALTGRVENLSDVTEEPISALTQDALDDLFPASLPWRNARAFRGGDIVVAGGDGPVIAGVLARPVDRTTFTSEVEGLVARAETGFSRIELDDPGEVALALKNQHQGKVLEAYISFDWHGFDVLATTAWSGETIAPMEGN
ncbi:MAG: hypothetical protein AAGE80_00455 [Pseudomonadota bacterium]